MTNTYITVCEGKIQAENDENIVKAEYKEKTYYFCEAECLEGFLKNPEEFLVSHKPAPAPKISLDSL